MRSPPLSHLCQIGVLALLAFTVLWRGGKSLESTWMLLGIGVFCILVRLLQKKRGGEDVCDAEMWSPIILFIILTGVSYIFSSTQNYGLDEVLATAGVGFIFLWVITEKERNPEGKFEERFVKLLTLVTVLSCLIGIAIYIAQPVNRFVGTFFDWRFHTDYWPNAFAQFLLLAWPIVLLYCGSVRRLTGRKLTRDKALNLLHIYGPVSLALGSLLLTYSRGALIAFVGQIGLLTLLVLKQQKTVQSLHAPLRRIGASLLIGLFVFIAVNEVRSTLHPVQSVAEKVTFSAAEGNSSIHERASFWIQSAILMVQKPVFGWGPYSFRFIQPRLQKSPLASSDHPHNVFLKFGMERGMATAAVFLLIVVSIMSHGLKLAMTGKRFHMQSDHAHIGYALLITSVAGVIAHNLIDYNLQFVGIALPFWVIMGIVFSHAFVRRKTSGRNTWFTVERKRMITISLASVLLLIALREGYFLTTSSFGRHAEASGDYDQAINYYNRSSGEWFSRDMHLSKAHLHLGEATMDSATESIGRYFEQNKEDARAWKLLAELRLLENKFEESVSAYEKAFKLGSWNDLSISRGLLEVLIALSFTQPTSDAAADSKRLELHPRIAQVAPVIEKRAIAFANAIERNLHFSALSPNPEEAIKIFITLSVLYPEKAEEYQKYKRRIENKTNAERAKIKARTPGWLW